MAHLIVKSVATDTEGTHYAMMYWLYESGKREHVANLELHEIGAGYEAYFCKNQLGHVIMPKSVYDHLNIEGSRRDWQLLELQTQIGDLFTIWIELINECLDSNEGGSIDLTTRMLEQKKAA